MLAMMLVVLAQNLLRAASKKYVRVIFKKFLKAKILCKEKRKLYYINDITNYSKNLNQAD